MHIRKEVPPAASPSTLEGVEGGNTSSLALHGLLGPQIAVMMAASILPTSRRAMSAAE